MTLRELTTTAHEFQLYAVDPFYLEDQRIPIQHADTIPGCLLDREVSCLAVSVDEQTKEPCLIARLAKEASDRYDEYRVCSVCGKPFNEGYCYGDGLRYYCSDDCLHHDFTDEEWQQECDEDETSYWTQW